MSKAKELYVWFKYGPDENSAQHVLCSMSECSFLPGSVRMREIIPSDKTPGQVIDAVCEFLKEHFPEDNNRVANYVYKHKDRILK